ncbi:hypothetical protein MRX96_027691 [Rhipicephalus microplus]
MPVSPRVKVQERTPAQATRRQPLGLRVSSVPSRKDETCLGRSLVPPPVVTAVLTKRRANESAVELGKSTSQDGCTKSQTTYSGVRTLKRATTERTALNECATRGDHNVSGLPQQEGLALDEDTEVYGCSSTSGTTTRAEASGPKTNYCSTQYERHFPERRHFERRCSRQRETRRTACGWRCRTI